MSNLPSSMLAISQRRSSFPRSHGSLVFSDEIDEQPTVKLPDASEATLMIEPRAAGMPQEHTPTMLLPPANPASLDEKIDEEDEAEKRRRAALLGFGIPLLGALADAGPEQIPSIPGTPLVALVPSLQGAPLVARPVMVPGQALGPGTPALPGPRTPIPAPFNPAWPAGRHTIHASETLTHRSTLWMF